MKNSKAFGPFCGRLATLIVVALLSLGAASASAKLAPTYYEILGVPTSVSESDLKRAYMKLVKVHHPDLHAAADQATRVFHETKMKEINEAYENLREGGKRSHYDNRPTAPAWRQYTPDHVGDFDGENYELDRSEDFAESLYHRSERVKISAAGDAWNAFVRMFFHKNGNCIAVEEFIKEAGIDVNFARASTNHKKALETVYQNFVAKMASEIDFVKDTPLEVADFVKSFSSGNYVDALADLLANRAQGLEKAVASSQHEQAVAIKKFSHMASEAFIESLSQACPQDLKGCLKTLTVLMIQKPKIGEMMSTEAQKTLIQLIDRVIKVEDEKWLMSAEYFQFMRIRQRMVASVGSLAASAADCMAHLTGDAYKRIKRKFVKDNYSN